MTFNKTRLAAAILAVGLPMAAFAQSSVIVPPPAAPGSAAAQGGLAPYPVAVATPAQAQTRPAGQAAQQASPYRVQVPSVAAVTAAPAARGVTAPVAAPQQAAPQAGAPAVIPPTTASGLNPASQATAGGSPVIDIALPDAPKPVAALSDLKPSAPGVEPGKKARAKVKHAAKKSGDGDGAENVKTAVDPYSGIVGTPVSDSQLNRFVFPEAVEGVFFQEGAPLPDCPDKADDMNPCHPVFLNAKHMMLLQLRAGAKGPVQMLVHLRSGRMETMNLMPAPGPGAVVRVEGAEDGPSDARLAAERSKGGVAGAGQAGGMSGSEQNVDVLSRFARGDIPAGFEPVAVNSAPVHFELFDVVQQASWTDGAGLRAHLFQVRARSSTPVVISPELFRREGVKALALDRDTITNTEPALLYMLEYVPTENN
ncbi:type-F conjugative transfer system secretin TraK [Paraburkholderia sp. A2RO-4L]|nr:type-F conjugative transfer system secretin TraK [Burkholderia vietnamiensis]